MTARNNITGDLIATRSGSSEDVKKFEEGWERIFGKKTEVADVDETDYLLATKANADRLAASVAQVVADHQQTPSDDVVGG